MKTGHALSVLCRVLIPISWSCYYRRRLILTLSLVLFKSLVNSSNQVTFFFLISLAKLTSYLDLGFILFILFSLFCNTCTNVMLYTRGNKNKLVKNLPILRHVNQKILGHQEAQFPLHVPSFSAILPHTDIFYHFNTLNYGNGYEECKHRTTCYLLSIIDITNFLHRQKEAYYFVKSKHSLALHE